MPSVTRRLLTLLSLSFACTCGPPRPPEASLPTAAACPGLHVDELAEAAPALQEAHLESALRAFEEVFDQGRFEEALGCAQLAARLNPDEPAAHLNRALALDALGGWHDAHLAYGRALALAPHEPEVMHAFADFLERDGSDDALETAVVLARTGRDLSRQPQAGAALALVEARAANALGRSLQALSAAETAWVLDERAEALLERGIALFELTRVEEADRVLAEAVAALPDDPRALHWRGLVLRHLGDEAQAEGWLRKAAALDPEGFPLPLEVSAADFASLVEREVRALPASARQRLEAEARLSKADLPAVDDLRDPSGAVLSPTILGLFVPGPPGGRSDIVLYRKNLLRVVRSRDELRRQVRDTLLHELGHLAGESDAQLRDRGL